MTCTLWTPATFLNSECDDDDDDDDGEKIQIKEKHIDLNDRDLGLKENSTKLGLY